MASRAQFGAAPTIHIFSFIFSALTLLTKTKPIPISSPAQGLPACVFICPARRERAGIKHIASQGGCENETVRSYPTLPFYHRLRPARIVARYPYRVRRRGPKLPALQHRAGRRERLSYQHGGRWLRRQRPEYRSQGEHPFNSRREENRGREHDLPPSRHRFAELRA